MTRTLLTLSLAVSLAGCGEPIRVNAPPPPQEWLQCAPAPDMPNVTPLAPVAGTYAKPEVDARDSLIARYIMALRAAHFDCSNQLGKVRDYYAGG